MGALVWSVGRVRSTSELRLEPSPGHVPGHVCVAIESQGAHGLVTGDATHHPVQWAESGWTMVADADPARAVETRRRLRADAASRAALGIGTHYAPPCAGRIVAQGTGFAFRAQR